jgi:hypothetical protein
VTCVFCCFFLFLISLATNLFADCDWARW